MVGYHRRFSATFKRAKQIFDEGILGKLEYFEGYAFSADFLGAKINQSLTRGGVLEDSTVHIVDLGLWFFNQMEIQESWIKSILGQGSEDEAYFKVTIPGGLEGEFRTSWCQEGYRLPEMGLIIKGAKGVMKVNEDRLKLDLNEGTSYTLFRQDLNDIVPFFIGGSEYQRQDQLFVESILTGSQVQPDFRTASKVETIIDQIKQKARLKS
jgi:predicted dehydrogenase